MIYTSIQYECAIVLRGNLERELSTVDWSAELCMDFSCWRKRFVHVFSFGGQSRASRSKANTKYQQFGIATHLPLEYLEQYFLARRELCQDTLNRATARENAQTYSRWAQSEACPLFFDQPVLCRIIMHEQERGPSRGHPSVRVPRNDKPRPVMHTLDRSSIPTPFSIFSRADR